MEHQNVSNGVEDAVAGVVSSVPDVRLALLFGSLARRQGGPDSDLDIAVAGHHPLSAEVRRRLVERFAEVIGRPVDLVDLQAAGEPIFSQAIHNGKLIYCRDRNLYAELIKRMLFNHADFLPLRARILEERRRRWTAG